MVARAYSAGGEPAASVQAWMVDAGTGVDSGPPGLVAISTRDRTRSGRVSARVSAM